MLQSRPAWIWIAVALAALGLRALLLPLSPKFPYPFDHGEFARWGMQATDEGVLNVYDKRPQAYGLRQWIGNDWNIDKPPLPRLCNYPPLSVYVLWGSDRLFRALTDDRTLNTVVARAVFSIWSILAELILAAGCAALVRQVRPDSSGLWAFAAVLFAPPIWWDTVFWGQTEAVILAPLIWMLVMMVRGRWLSAGILFGVAGAIKPQVILFAPVWMLVLLTVRPIRKPAIALMAAGIAFLAPAAPYFIHSGWAWFRSSYVENLTSTYSQRTTMWAFNLWYLDVLLNDSDDAVARWAGLTKNTWSHVALIASLAFGLIWAGRRWRSDTRGLVLWAALSILIFVTVPTQVHERYLVLAIVPLIVACAIVRRLWPGVIVLSIVAMSQMTWPIWKVEAPGTTGKLNAQLALTPPMKGPKQAQAAAQLRQMVELQQKEYWRRRWKTLPWEWASTIAGLAGAAWCVLAITTATTAPAGVNRRSPDSSRSASGPT